VTCTKDADCPAPTDPCTPQICNTGVGVCVDDPEQDGIMVPGLTQTPGDCNVVICVGGVSTKTPDDTDVPTSPTNDCVIPQCNGGAASQPSKSDGLPCKTHGGSGDGFCAQGTCEQCAFDGNCTGSSDDCHWPACDPGTHTCYVGHAAAGKVTANPAQIPSDCLEKQCDGNGNVVDVFDGSDTLSDNNVCTTDTCKAGSPPTMTYPAVTDGSTCNSGGGHSCVAGLCNGCTPNQTCQPAACVNTVLYKAATCSSGGSCPTQVQQDCFPYKCATSGCPSSCTADTDCSNTTTHYCTGNVGAPGVCTPKTTGGSCSRDAMCTNGHCVDGVCCNVASCGACQVCTVKTAGQDGTCGAVPAGQDPKNNCNDTGAASCGNNGSCDGAGACQNYPAGTSCGNQVCSTSANNYTGPKTCNGNGACVTPTVVSCAPYKCAGNGNFACTTTCSADTGCATSPASYCNGSNQCKNKVAAGGTCVGGGSGHDCISGSCGGNNTCCSAACLTAGTCGSTGCQPTGSGSPGACIYPATGTDCGTNCTGGSYTAKTCNGSGTCSSAASVACAPYICNAGQTACTTTCSGDPGCASGSYCNGTACTGKVANGGSCTAGGSGHDCASNICGSNGACCATTCTATGTCGTTACNAGTGSGAGNCSYPGSGTTCTTASCNGSGPYTYTAPAVCTGAGTCGSVPTPVSCGQYTCAVANNGCYGPGSCTAGDVSHCLSGDFCDTSGTPTTCEALKGPGGTCSSNSQCTAPGKCGVTGTGSHCCSAACSLNVGDPCTYVDCDAAGACAFAPSTTSCASLGSSCSGGTLHTPTTCDGAGTCQYTDTSCSPYAGCSGTVCAGSCPSNNGGGDGSCASGFYCNGSQCVNSQPAGAACHTNAMCTSNSCDIGGAKTCN
jgi:hypothetical protein